MTGTQWCECGHQSSDHYFFEGDLYCQECGPACMTKNMVELVPMTNGLEPRKFLRLLRCPDCDMEVDKNGFGTGDGFMTHHYNCVNDLCWVDEIHISIGRDSITKGKKETMLAYLEET